MIFHCACLEYGDHRITTEDGKDGWWVAGDEPGAVVSKPFDPCGIVN